ncbi:hypothetical protein [Ramlibacter sp.]|uniref:hypothetical protein n=1 Tax=Ramlibacter sp. TaxID=1917967 RepID=UPI002CDE0730|nr:hypothetical protein [Ramlibacter sp.]HWI84172.1 hypothetical protein [Ramlibacter sp.]
MNAAPAPSGGNFVLLRAGALRLLLPQSDVGPAQHMQGQPAPLAGRPGLFEQVQDGATRTVAALSDRLRPLQVFPGGRFVLTTLATAAAGELRFAWDEVRVLIGARLEPSPLPAAMRSRGGPIDGYVQLDGELLLCTTAQRVLAFAAGPGE